MLRRDVGDGVRLISGESLDFADGRDAGGGGCESDDEEDFRRPLVGPGRRG